MIATTEQELQQHLFEWCIKKGITLNNRQMVAVSEAARSIVQAVSDTNRPSQPGSGWQSWLASDDTCPVSLFMLKCLRRHGAPVGERIVYPSTAAAWANCESLLEAEPKFRDQLRLMKEISPEWWILVENWDNIRGVRTEQRNSELLRVLW